MDDLGCLQDFFYIKPDIAPGANFMCTELMFNVRDAWNSFSFPACVNSNFENLRKSACSHDLKEKEDC